MAYNFFLVPGIKVGSVAFLLGACMSILGGGPARAADAFTPPFAINSDYNTAPIGDAQATLGIGNGVEIAVWIGIGSTPMASGGDDLANLDGMNEDLCFSRSLDYGQTWSPMKELKIKFATDDGDDLDPNLATDGKGNWMVVWRSRDSQQVNKGNDPDIMMSFSSDDGLTWSAPSPVNNDAVTDGQKMDDYPHVATDGKGNWAVSWTFMDPRTGRWEEGIAAAASSDRGAHWSDPVKVGSFFEGSLIGIMSSLATDNQGHWVTVWDAPSSATGGDLEIFSAVSTTNGVSWTAPKVLNTNAAADSGSDRFPRVATDGLGRWICTWTTVDTLGGTVKAGSNILFARSTDNGQTWSTQKPVNPNALTEGGLDLYSRVVTDRHGQWSIMWETRQWGGDLDIAYSTSTDNGAHWTAMAPVNPNALTDSDWEGGGPASLNQATDGNGHWGFVWDGHDPQGGTTGPGWDIMYTSLEGTPPAGPPLTLLSPNGGQTLHSGALTTVTWESNVDIAGTAVKFELWDGQQRLADLGYDWNPAGKGGKQVYLPLVPEGNQYRIRVLSNWDTALFDDSDSTLTVLGGCVRLDWPVGGTVWQSGDLEWAWWETNPFFSGTAVRLELWRSGARVAQLGTGWEPDGEGVTWFNVPVVPTASDYKVRLISIWNEAWFVENEGSITIRSGLTGTRSAVDPASWGRYR